MKATRQYVLLVPGSTDVLPVPEGQSLLVNGPRTRKPRLARPGRHKADPGADTITLEPVEMQRRPFLLMLHSAAGVHHGVHHNGQAAWPVTLLRVGDEVRVGGVAFFVSSQKGQSVFPPQAEHVGVACPICTVEFDKDTLLYACGSCGTLLHCEDSRWPEQKRLECARVASVCPKCQQAIDFEEGLEWEPEL